MTGEQIISIDTAIRHCYEVYLERDDMCKECREEHRQLAKWLEELKESRETINRQNAEIEGFQNELSVVKLKNSDLQSTYQALKIDLESMRSVANSYKMNYEESLSEIERLNVELVGMRGACESYKMHYDNAQAEIEYWKKEIQRIAKMTVETDRKGRV